MERLQKKCIAGSLMTHCALVGVLCLAAAFSKDQPFKPLKDELPHPPLPLMIIPKEVTDGLTQIGGGGGKPAAAAPVKKEEPKQEPVAQPPVASVAQPVTEPVVQPKPEKQEEAPKAEKPVEKPVPDPLKIIDKPKKQVKKPADKPKAKDDLKPEAKPESKEPKKPAVKVDLAVKTINPTAADDKRKKQQEIADARQKRIEQENYDREVRRRQETLNNVGKGLDKLGTSLSSGGVSIEIGGPGSGGGSGSGQTFVNYAQWVKEIYDRNWVVNDSVIGDDGVVRVEIVVQRNGTARGKIIKRSGNTALDRTVQNAIDRVSSIGYSFPEGSTENTRTFIINFNLSSKRQTG